MTILGNGFARRMPDERTWHTDTFGDIIYGAALRSRPCWMRNRRGHTWLLPVSRWLGGAMSTAADRRVDDDVLDHCKGHTTIDLGCGPGRFTAALQAGGTAALGVDTSSLAVELTRRRGGVALRHDFFSPLPAEGHWERVLLTDGNIGIGGSPLRTLRRVAHLLAPAGLVVAELDPAGASPRGELVRCETAERVGQWFPWSRIGVADIHQIACAAGFLVVNIIEEFGRVIAVLMAADRLPSAAAGTGESSGPMTTSRQHPLCGIAGCR